MGSVNYGVIFYLPDGGAATAPYICKKTNGTWGEWTCLTTNAELNDGTSTRVSVKSSGGATRMTIDCTSPNDGYVGLEGSDGAWYRRLKFLSDGKIIYAYKATGGAEVTKLISDKPS